MQERVTEIKLFFYSQAFADGFITTISILLPALVAYYLNLFELGITISLGALCVSLTDSPGPVIHKRNSMLICAGLIFIVAIITALVQANVYLLGLVVLLLSFFFSMFTVYGGRAASVGNASLLILILTMDSPINNNDVLLHSFLVLFGGLWYTSISLITIFIRPYRIAQRSLGECIREMSKFLFIKSEFYNPATKLDEDYKKLIAQQILVNEKLDAVREVLFKTRQITNESTNTGKKLLVTFIDTVDLFEDITAIYYDYDLLRERFKDTGVLEQFSILIRKLAEELERIGNDIQTNSTYTPYIDFDKELIQLKELIDSKKFDSSFNVLVLKKILVNIRKISQRIKDLTIYFESDYKGKTKNRLDHSHFISHQSLDPKIFWNNLNFQSAVFKHSLRVAIACIAGFAIAKTILYSQHSYWILLTIAFIIKPAFSLTKQRNYERITGTLIGGAIGVAIIVLFPNKSFQFFAIVFFMMGTYSFLRINYLAMVIFTTPFVILLFNFLGTHFVMLAQERIIDTAIGCVIAFSASYFLFPIWESNQLKNYMLNMLKANAHYLQKILDGLNGKKIDLLSYKLARKEVYISSANLSAAFQRMLSEPKSKQISKKNLHSFVVLNHILFSNIASVGSSLIQKEPGQHPAQAIHLTKRSLALLKENIEKFNGAFDNENSNQQIITGKNVSEGDEGLLIRQLEFINKLSQDLNKITDDVLAA